MNYFCKNHIYFNVLLWLHILDSQDPFRGRRNIYVFISYCRVFSI